MNCMEVWGGNCSTDTCLTRPGIDIWIQSDAGSATMNGGSDIHLVSSCASGRITRTLLADICAIGPMFSEVTSTLRDLMKRNVNTIGQQRFVNQMNQRLEERSEHGVFASALLSTYFAPTRTLSLCNAGHPPPLLYRYRTNSWSVVRGEQTVSAASPSRPGVVDASDYQQLQLKLETGDMVLSFSNSLTECRNADGQTLGITGVLERVSQLDASNPDEMIEQLTRDLREEHSTNSGMDELTLFLCRATNTGVTWRDNVLAPLRLFRRVSDDTQITG